MKPSGASPNGAWRTPVSASISTYESCVHAPSKRCLRLRSSLIAGSSSESSPMRAAAPVRQRSPPHGGGAVALPVARRQ
ncbi:hypothetical protein [Burkholderia pseudomallei]|uniref:hypothetical protein n=1 Tax=Burkholderia pseudomallei TaxID=28450 RepID=UPI0005727776|nr:hypothetical protein [Burkholderia pseudomallei]MBG1248199.1 hypothetical protein [Burkholderia pseudomallei]MBO7866080.1 hypothetical protein [Burkholderia pseudomallei]MBO7873929.1 hypothetical protein [Burkholderia pseudomallei]OMR97280.1 hypothetical protein AQ734_16935 [Burkholderia pseudomallei]OMS19398.1 hypothetical protein AQ737_05120 [Burkholderia pseudomallei]